MRARASQRARGHAQSKVVLAAHVVNGKAGPGVAIIHIRRPVEPLAGAKGGQPAGCVVEIEQDAAVGGRGVGGEGDAVELRGRGRRGGGGGRGHWRWRRGGRRGGRGRRGRSPAGGSRRTHKAHQEEEKGARAARACVAWRVSSPAPRAAEKERQSASHQIQYAKCVGTGQKRSKKSGGERSGRFVKASCNSATSLLPSLPPPLTAPARVTQAFVPRCKLSAKEGLPKRGGEAERGERCVVVQRLGIETERQRTAGRARQRTLGRPGH